MKHIFYYKQYILRVGLCRKIYVCEIILKVKNGRHDKRNML